MEWNINDTLKSRAYGFKKEKGDEALQQKAQSYER